MVYNLNNRGTFAFTGNIYEYSMFLIERISDPKWTAKFTHLYISRHQVGIRQSGSNIHSMHHILEYITISKVL